MLPRIKEVGIRQQAGSQVLRFGGENILVRRQDFSFYYMFKTNFSGHHKIWESTAPECLPVTSGLFGSTISKLKHQIRGGGNLYTIMGCMNFGKSLAGRKIN